MPYTCIRMAWRTGFLYKDAYLFYLSGGGEVSDDDRCGARAGVVVEEEGEQQQEK